MEQMKCKSMTVYDPLVKYFMATFERVSNLYSCLTEMQLSGLT